MNMDKVAFITGVTGQDGAHLAELLIQMGGKSWRIPQRIIKQDMEIGSSWH